MYHQYPALVPPMPFKDKVAPKKVGGAKVIWTADGPVLVWLERQTKDQMQKAVRYVVYRFAPGEKININNPAHIVAITTQPFMKLPYTNGKTQYTYVVTALDRMWNESAAKKVKAKL